MTKKDPKTALSKLETELLKPSWRVAAGITGALAVAVLVSTCGGCSWINGKAGWEPNNPVEEAAEEITNAAGEAVIKHFTGVDVDLDFDFTEESEEK